MKSKSFAILLLLLSCFSSAFAARTEAPLVDLSKGITQDVMAASDLEIDQNDSVPAQPVTHQNEPMEQRVLRLERQISNLADMNYSSKMEKLQQQVQQLQGLIEVQNHELTQLKDQVKSFYADLDQRLTKAQPSDVSSEEKKTPINAALADKPVEKDPSSSAGKSKEFQKYEEAFKALNKKEFEQAISGFQTFIKEYPASSYSVNAHYWLGEIFYIKGKYDLANKEFQTIIVNYPENPKVADAMLKVALIAMDTGNYSKAKQNLLKVQKQFPGTTAAKIATLRLKELKQK